MQEKRASSERQRPVIDALAFDGSSAAAYPCCSRFAPRQHQLRMQCSDHAATHRGLHLRPLLSCSSEGGRAHRQCSIASVQCGCIQHRESHFVSECMHRRSSMTAPPFGWRCGERRGEERSGTMPAVPHRARKRWSDANKEGSERQRMGSRLSLRRCTPLASQSQQQCTVRSSTPRRTVQ